MNSYFQNIQSLQNKFYQTRADPILSFGHLLIFAETWLEPEVHDEDPVLQLRNYKLHLNSFGRGKGFTKIYSLLINLCKWTFWVGPIWTSLRWESFLQQRWPTFSNNLIILTLKKYLFTIYKRFCCMRFTDLTYFTSPHLLLQPSLTST